MKRLALVVLGCAVLGALSGEVSALLIPFSKERIEAVGEHCIHGYDGNFGAVGTYYAGDAAALNEHLATLIKSLDESQFPTKVATRKIVLHPGPMVLPEYLEPHRGVATDWQQISWFERETTMAEVHVQVDVWVGGRIKLDDLRIPEGFTVESGREIETFVERHQTPAPAPVETP